LIAEIHFQKRYKAQTNGQWTYPAEKARATHQPTWVARAQKSKGNGK